MTNISGIRFEEKYKNKSKRKIDNIEVVFIGIKQLIKNKETTGSKKDNLNQLKLKKMIIKN